jgi:hypothetical protein
MKIDFEYTTDYGVFRDAITLPDNHSYTDDELEAMKVSRRDKWIAVVTAPSEDTRVSIDVDGETYYELDGVPPSGATLLEVEGVWHYKE